MQTTFRPRGARACLLLAGSCMAGLSGAVAAELETEFSAGIGRTDNILRTAEDPIEESISSLGVELDFSSSGGNGSIVIDARGDYVSYRDDTFDSEVIGGARLLADYVFVEETLDWDLEYTYGQQVFNPLAPVRPDNRQDVRFLTTGPNLEFDLGSRFFFGARADYTTISYERTPNDNTRTGVSASIGRRLSAGRTLSIVGDFEQVEFDLQDATTPDFDRQRVFLRFESVNSRGSLTASAGVNEIERQGSSDTRSGTLFEVDWERELAAGMRLGLGAGTRLSDQGNMFRFLRNMSTDLRETEDVVGTTVPFRNDFASAMFSIDRERTRASLVALYSEEDYEDEPTLNREVTRFNLSVLRNLSRKIFGEAGVSVLSREFSGIDRDDRDVRYTLALGYRITPTFSARLSFQRFDRSSNQDVTEFDEDRVFLRLSYVPEWNRK